MRSQVELSSGKVGIVIPGFGFRPICYLSDSQKIRFCTPPFRQVAHNLLILQKLL